MPGSAEIKVDFGKKLAIPSESIIDKMNRKVVFVDKGHGRFEPRTVTTGMNFESMSEILNGVSKGEMVVNIGVTNLDAEATRQGIR